MELVSSSSWRSNTIAKRGAWQRGRRLRQFLGKHFAVVQSRLGMDAFLHERPVVVAAGMDFEARLAGGPGIAVVYGQGRDEFRERLHAYGRAGSLGFISFGVAGGLAPHLRPGDAVVASAVVTSGGTSRTCPAWTRSLLTNLPHAHHFPVFGAEAAIMTVAEKEALWKTTGAVAVDVESGLAAEVAAHYRLPFAVLRVVLDPSHRTLPPSALAGARDDGKTDPFAVLRSLLSRPHDLPSLLLLAGDARKANRTLLRSRQALGPIFGFLPLDAGELALNVK